MNIRELTFKGEADPVLYACGACSSLHSPRTYACKADLAHEAARRSAEECCAVRHCACGAEIEKCWTMCHTCRERKRLRGATVVTDYSGPVFLNGARGDWQEGYSSDVDALRESHEDWDEEPPAYCHPCTSIPLRLDIERIIESACSDQHEDAPEQIEGYDDLAAAVEAFNEAQTCVTYWSDTSRVIVLDQARFEALIAEPEGGA